MQIPAKSQTCLDICILVSLYSIIKLVFILLTIITFSDVRQLEEVRKSARISRHFELTGQEQMHLTAWNSEFGCEGLDLRGAKRFRARRTRKNAF